MRVLPTLFLPVRKWSMLVLTHLVPPPADHQQMELTIAPQQERVVMALTTAVQQALQASAPVPPSDPLRPYRLMQEACRKQVSTHLRSLAEILEISISTVHSWGKVVP